jgi:hypothetical protein
VLLVFCNGFLGCICVRLVFKVCLVVVVEVVFLQ